MITTRFVRWFSILLLAACGSSEPGVGSGGTGAANTNGVANGAITGFGSVILEGKRYDDTLATVRIDLDPLSPSSATTNALRLGMQAEVDYQSSTALSTSEIGQTVTVSAEVIGPISAAPALNALGNYQLSAAGQTVIIVTNGAFATVLDGVTSAEQLALANRIEVHGHRDSNERIIATRIELLEADAQVVTRVVGRVSARTSDTAWQINGLSVQVNASTARSPAGYGAAVGDVVAVYANSNPSAAPTLTLNASSVKRLSVARPENDGWRVGGVIRSIDRSAQRLNLGRFDVDISASSLNATVLASLSVGDTIRVLGSASGNRVAATTIEVLKATSPDIVEITGAVSGYIAGSRARIREAVLTLDGNITYVNGGVERMTDGALVQVKGTLVQGLLAVQRIEFFDQADQRTTAFAGRIGTVNNANSAAPSFTLGQVLVTPGASARYLFQNGSLTNATQLQVDREVIVAGAFVSGTFVASEVVFKDSQSGPRTRARGIVSSISLADRRLVIDGVNVSWTDSTEISGVLSAAALGRFGEAEGNLVNGVVVATKLKLGR